MVEDDVEVLHCVRHSRRETVLRCGKCNSPICTRCVVLTPVGARCATCAQLRRLPQLQIGWWLFGRSTAGGIVTSAVSWYLVSYVRVFGLFLGILVGLAVGEAMSRLARRRSGLLLEAGAVMAVVVGLAAVVWGEYVANGFAGLSAQSAGLLFVLPTIIASVVAVVKLR